MSADLDTCTIFGENGIHFEYDFLIGFYNGAKGRNITTDVSSQFIIGYERGLAAMKTEATKNYRSHVGALYMDVCCRFMEAVRNKDTACKERMLRVMGDLEIDFLDEINEERVFWGSKPLSKKEIPKS